MDTAMIGLQTAVIAAAAGAGEAVNVPVDGESFSSVLANTAATNVTEGNVPAEDGGYAIPEQAAESGDMLTEAVKNIENLDKAIRDSLRMLLKRVIDSFKASRDGTERKTDMFAVLFVSSDELGDTLYPEKIPDIDLLCAKILGKIGDALESKISEDTDGVVKEIEDVVSAILGTDDDTDENAAAEAVAAMLGVPAETLDDFTLEAPEEKAEAVQNIAEAFKAPMEAVKETAPERVSDAERLYSEFAAEAAVKTEEAPEAVTSAKAGFAAYRVNDAGEQVSTISERASDTAEYTSKTEAPAAEAEGTVVYRETAAPKAADEADGKTELNGEAAAIAVQPAGIFTESADAEMTVTEGTAYEPADIQVRETILEEISDMPENDGVKELVLILRPKELGQVAVKLTKENGVLSVILSAQYNEVGRMLADRAAQLGNSLQSGDVKVKSVDVVEPGNAAEQMGLNFTDRGFGFAGNSGGTANGGGNGSYNGVDGEDGAAGETEEIEIIREAGVWWTTTA